MPTDSMSVVMAASVVVFSLVLAFRKAPVVATIWAWLPDEAKALVPFIVSGLVIGAEALWSGRSWKQAAGMALSAAALPILTHSGMKLAPFIPYGGPRK
jgi:hypothetical protein